MYRFFFERVLETVLRDDRRTSPHIHVSWVVFCLGLLGDYRVVLHSFGDFFLEILLLIPMESTLVDNWCCIVLNILDCYYFISIIIELLIIIIILFIESSVSTFRYIYDRIVTYVLSYLL
jgi:hypothetical protein